MNQRISKIRSDIWIAAILCVLFFAGMAWIQFASPDMPDNDGFYHIKLAYLMRTEGLKPEFKWLPQSILNKNEFYDHHFLFHVALIPFTFGDLRLGEAQRLAQFRKKARLGLVAQAVGLAHPHRQLEGQLPEFGRGQGRGGARVL